MGVPALFRFLSRKYPKIVSPVLESPTKDSNGDDIAVDITGPNPNGEEFDNLYLDMNGIVHPCSHPEDRPPPRNEDEIMMEVFRYTDRIMAMVRPRKLLMIAVDGVAPRAKMNQQRSRRFRSAQEAEEKEKKREEAIAEILTAGGPAPDEDEKPWDSNVITPGTPFMDILAASLRYWVQYKLNTDPGWKNIKVIISDASVPGEGEHKIMEFIRSQRVDPRHDPNTRHVIYGLDADLIMLGLATHEPYFRVLREDVFFQQNSGGCRNCGEKGHIAVECTTVMEKKKPDKNAPLKPFIWLNVAILREYLEVELHIPGQVVPFDLERAIDDWVFIIFFVGNDFLPHLPSLDIREGAIDALVALWKKNLDVQGGYITCDGSMDLQRAQFMLDGLAEQEEEIFRRRKQTEERNEQRERDRAQSRKDNKAAKKSRQSYDLASADNVSVVPAPTTAAVIEKAPVPAATPAKKGGAKAVPDFHDLNQTINGSAMSNKDIVANRKALRTGDALEANMSAAAKLKAELMKPKDDPQTPGNKTPVSTDETTVPEDTASGKKRAFGEFSSDGLAPPAEPEVVDTVRLWEEGYKERYYVQKFKCDPDDVDFRRSIARDYVEGLAWVLLYYYQGCHSWTWFYPHHYAPFASDFDKISSLDISFVKGEPARPYEQLLGVMPVASNHVLPEPLRKLMTDEEYGITDFYPLDFPVDLNGKKFAWQGVVLLPFIDQTRLLEACAKGYKLLTPDESKRNARGHDQLIFSEQNTPLYDHVIHKLYSKKASKDKASLDMTTSGGLGGYIQKDPAYTPNSSIPFPLQSKDVFPDIDMDTSVALRYIIPKSKFVHKSMLLKGLRPPPRTLDRRDLDGVRYNTNNAYGGPRNNDRYGNNNRSRDVQDPSQNRTAPRSNNNGPPVPPWQQANQPQQSYGQPQPYGSGYGNVAPPPPPTGQHTYFGAPPPLQNGRPVPIPGFPPVGGYGASAPGPPGPHSQTQQQQDPYSRYQSSGYASNGYNSNGYTANGNQQWRGYQ